MSPFTQRHYDPKTDFYCRANLKSEIREAIAWGVPDRESTGLTASEFTTLLHKALKEIESLEAQLSAKQ